MPGNEKAKDDLLFSGRGSPAFMSLNEPALKLLHERYSETFAITHNNENQVHLFLIKVGLWSLVWTFTPRDFASEKIEIPQVLDMIEETLEGGNSDFQKSLDAAVVRANDRMRRRIDAFSDKRS
jgi:hypothetical protein